MKLKILNATFGNAVRLQTNKVEAFITSDKTEFDLEYDTEAQLLFISHPGKETKLVGVTNIKDMTLVTETSGNTGGDKAKKPSKA